MSFSRMKVKTADLIGPALDWAVGVAAGTPNLHILKKPGKTCVYGKLCMPSGEIVDWPVQPSTDWSQGGPIIEREKISVGYERYGATGGDSWDAVKATATENGSLLLEYGPTPLIAAMRCFVASKLGGEIEVPDELMR